MDNGNEAPMDHAPSSASSSSVNTAPVLPDLLDMNHLLAAVNEIDVRVQDGLVTLVD